MIDDAAVQLDNMTREWHRLVPRDYHDAELIDLDPEVREPIKRWLRQVTDTEHDPRLRGPNMVLLGPIGTGKTHAAFAAMRELFWEGTPSNQRFARGGLVRRSFRYWSVPAALMRLRMHDRETDVMAELLDARVLLLDELGTAKATEWAQEQLFGVIDARRTELRPTVATTNLDLPALEGHLGPAAFSRLVGDALIVEVKGQNRRKQPPPLRVIEGRK